MTVRIQDVRRAGIAATTSLALAFGGCSLGSPYAHWERPDPDSVLDLETYTLPYAIAYAQNVRNAYREKLGDHAALANSVGPGLITLSAAVLGLAAYGASTDAILGVALGGGTVYTLANWFSNNTQELVYIAGMEAMSCAVEAVLPLNFSESARINLDSDLARLNNLIDRAASAVGNVRSGLTQVGAETPLAQAANAALISAEQAVQTADQAYAAGRNLSRQVDGVGTNLVVAVDRITIAVDAAVQQSQPRLESVINIIGQLSSASEIFAPGLGLADTLAAKLAPDDGLEQSLDLTTPGGRLQMALNELATVSLALTSATRRVAAIVNGVNEKRPLQTLRDCGVNVGEVSTDIAVAPGQVRAIANTASEHVIIVSGGKSPYVARFLSGPTPGVTVQNPIPGDRAIEIKVSETATAGEYTLFVADAANHSKTVTVSVIGNGQPRTETRDDDESGDGVQERLQALADDIRNETFRLENAPDVSFTVTESVLDANGERVQVTVTPSPEGSALPADEELIAAIGGIEKNGSTISDRHSAVGQLSGILLIQRPNG